MQLTPISAATILAFIYAAPAIGQGQTTCDGNMAPNWSDCDTLAAAYQESSAVLYKEDPGVCIYPGPPEGVDGNSLNCIISVCFEDGTNGAVGNAIYTDYISLKAVCDGSTTESAGGTVDDDDYLITVSAVLNPDYNPSSKRNAVPEQRSHPRSWTTLERRQGGVCTDGTGDFKIIDTFNNIEKSGDMYAVTGRLPSGSSYTIMDSDSESIGVSTSVTVEAGFFDLFDVSASVSVSSDYTVTTTTGVTVVVDCDEGQEGIIYLYPVFTEYFGECTSNDNAPIYVYVPIDTQNNYMVQCLSD